MKWSILIFASLTAAVVNNQVNGISTYGTLDAPTLPKFLGSLLDPWGSARQEDEVPDTNVTRRYNFTISRDYKSPDGFNKSVILVNDQFPGPLIEANWGDTIEVTVYNNIQSVTEGVTLHWHGQPLRKSPGQDGTPGVSQCPVPPGSSLTYSFRAESFGTGWYHSHISGQYTDGLYGPMVVYGPSQLPYDVDLGPIMLSDYNHDNYINILENAFKPQPIFPVIDNNLINGKGISNCSIDPSYNCTPYAELSKFVFFPGKVHRLRLINTGNDGTQKFTIDNHRFTVIANDYVPVQPYETDVITLAVGQRTDVLVNATGSGAYWMRSDFDVSCLNLTAHNNHALAKVYYKGTNISALPNTKATAWQSGACGNDPLSETVPLYRSKSLDASPYTEILNITLSPNATGNLNFFINGSSFEADYNSPLLFDAVHGSTSFPRRRNVFSYASNTVIRIIFESKYAVAHPMHFHGHNFRVLAQGYGKWDGKVQGDPSNPQRRDTQLFLRPPPDGRPSYMVIEWTSDNTGVWPLHCHTSIHASAGLIINILEGTNSIRQLDIPSNMQENCKVWSQWTKSHRVDQIDSGLR